MVKLLFVCTGNICRSPTAEGIMRHKLAIAGLADRCELDSAGTHGYHQGEPPDPRAIATARRFGVEIGDLRARQVTLGDLDHYDLIAVMEDSHRQQLRRLRPNPPRGRIRLLLSWLGQERPVPDPWYDDRQFVPVYRLIEQGVDALLADILVNGSSGY